MNIDIVMEMKIPLMMLIDEARKLTALVDELGDSAYSPQEYVASNNNLPVCDDAGDDWMNTEIRQRQRI